MDEKNHSFAPPTWGWTGFFSLAALEALAALIYLLSLPADAENAVILGFSLRRLVLIGVLLAPLVLTSLLAWWSYKPAWQKRWQILLAREKLVNTLMVILSAGLLACLLIPILLLSLYRTGGDFRFFAYYERLLPCLVWVGLFCLQSIIWLAWIGNLQWQSLRLLRTSFQAALVVFAVFALVWIFVAFTGIGITPDIIGWGDPSVPLLEWQIWLVWLVSSLFLLYLLSHRWPSRKDWFVCAIIWLLASGIWLAQPIQTAFFATAGRAPNFEIYPFSDGAYYGLYSQSLLIGNGYQTDQVPPRPLYIALLAGFHALAGQKYENVIALQTLFLAFFPVVLYLLGKELHSRPAGLFIALLAILRELTAIHVTAITNKASTSQMFFADLPSALVISLWALVSVRWLKSSGRTNLRPFWVGGVMGLSMLFRTQSIFMLPLVLLLALFSYRPNWRLWFRQCGWVLLGLMLAISPWILRNWQVTGRLAFDDPKSQTGVMAQRYSLSQEGAADEYTLRPGEDIQEYSSRVNQGLIHFMLSQTDVVASFISAHLMNAEIDNLLLLPVRDGIADMKELVMPDQPFWESWSGTPTPGQMLLMAINLFLIAVGIGAAWARLRWAGLSLLLMNLAYNGSNALARNSGWRYLIPIDWTTYVYAAIGFMEISVAIFLIMGFSPASLVAQFTFANQTNNSPVQPHKHSWKGIVYAGAVIFLLGCVPATIEHVFPKRYPAQAQTELAVEFLSTSNDFSSSINKDTLDRFLAQPGAKLLKGRAIYPRFYAAGDGEPRTAKAGYEPLDFPRTLFLIAAQDYYGLVMVRSDQAPSALPNSSDVIVLGCMTDHYLDAFAVLVKDQDNYHFSSDNPLPERCTVEPGNIP